MWKSIAKILRRDTSQANLPSSALTADGFLKFFSEKVESVRSATSGHQPPEILLTAGTSLSDFRTCTEDEVRKVIMGSPSKSCSLDPIPTTILKECIDDLLPFLTAMCNASLLEGHMPVSQRHAIITPLIKKPHLDATDLKNYRPVSNLTFISKVVERLVSERLVSFLQDSDRMPVEQSAYRKNHSTETALLRVISDLLNAMDKQEVTLLGLLDLSAAFDCVDHDILLSRLERTFGIHGSALGWIRSFLTDRTQRVTFRGQLSVIMRLVYGVPQGSVLGPLLFLLYTAELLDIIGREGMRAHSYADDTQVHVSTGAADAKTVVQRFIGCAEKIESWMSSNRLKMNAEKTQVIWIGSRQQLAKVDIKELQLLSANVQFSTTVSNLGVHLDGQLTMKDQVTALCRSCFFQLRQLRLIRSSLTMDAAKTLAQSFVGGRLDYCNSLLYGISDNLLRRVQSVQNAAARFITGTRKYDHITPVLRDLHWLPVRQRITFKIATLMYRCLNGLAPAYLMGDCITISSMPGRRQLRSSTSGQLYIPRTRTMTFGPRSFKVSGPTIWNDLPDRMKDPSLSKDSFKKLLKTFLFSR
jgi:hypothetical protein